MSLSTERNVKDLLARVARLESFPVGSTGSISGGEIELQDSGGATTWYPATDAGLIAALAAAGSGDAVRLPACAISGGPWAVAAGGTLTGQCRASILTGNVSIGSSGEVSFVRVVGAVTASGDNSRVRDLWVSPGAAETGITLSGDYSFAFRCYISPTSATTSVGIAVTGANATADGCLVDDAITRATVGAQVNGTDATIERCLIIGETAATLTNGSIIGSNLGGSSGAGLQVFTPGGRAENTIIGGTTDIVISSGALSVYGCQYDSITGVVTYEPGDRSSYSVEDFHAADIEAGTMTRHLPLAGNAGATLISTGAAWQSGALDLADADARTGILPIANGGTGAATLAGASIVTGTGTADYMAYWTGANAIAGDAAISRGAGGKIILNGGTSFANNAIYIGGAGDAVGKVNASFLIAAAGTNLATNGYNGGPYFFSRGNTYSQFANQRGYMGLVSGNPAGPLVGTDGALDLIAVNYFSILTNVPNVERFKIAVGGQITLHTATAPSGGGAFVVAMKTNGTTTPTGVAADSPVLFAKDTTNSSGTTAGQAALCVLDETTGYEYQFGRHARLPGGQQVAYVAKSANYTATDADRVILCTGGSAGITITLPAAANVPGQTYDIKKVDSGAGVVTVAAAGTEKIDGAATKIIEAQYECLTIVCDSATWNII